ATHNLGASRQVALEIMIPLGGRSLYGLLGARFRPSPGGDLKVATVIQRSDQDPLPYSSAIASATDLPRVGLPRLFAAAVLDGVRLEIANPIGAIPSGRLAFCAAAHGEIGSSQGVFSALA